VAPGAVIIPRPNLIIVADNALQPFPANVNDLLFRE
jgi:hypothetical protein